MVLLTFCQAMSHPIWLLSVIAPVGAITGDSAGYSSSGSSIRHNAPVISLLKMKSCIRSDRCFFYRILLTICKYNVKPNLFFIHERVNNLVYKNDLFSYLAVLKKEMSCHIPYNDSMATINFQTIRARSHYTWSPSLVA